MVKYVLLSHRALEAYIIKDVSHLHALYYKGGVEHLIWCQNPAEAMPFDSERDAWYYASRLMGFGYAKEMFGVVAFDQKLLDAAAAKADRYPV